MQHSYRKKNVKPKRCLVFTLFLLTEGIDILPDNLIYTFCNFAAREINISLKC